ncbi:MAG TPA: hypothetical protein PLP95_04630 [Microthrixaceae bacterium]|nr:hypothetical protein [Microthrixaceae bacterium]
MADEDQPAEDGGTDDSPADELNEGGKRAIDAERRKARDAEKRARTAETKLKDLEDAGKTETQKLRDDLADRDRQIAELPKQVRQQAVRFASEAARQGFLDPEDAFAFLPADLDLDDTDAVKAALEDLAGRKPHLVRQAPAPKATARPTATGGEHLGSTQANESAKERAAAALRAFRST